MCACAVATNRFVILSPRRRICAQVKNETNLQDLSYPSGSHYLPDPVPSVTTTEFIRHYLTNEFQNFYT